MIVKNESDVVLRCLDSVIDVIDYWVIVDTGSSDDTIEKITNFLQKIPGEMHQRPWRNFGENRSEAYLLAKGKADYILFMDADDVLTFSKEKTFGKLEKDCYRFWRGTKTFSYLKPQLVKANLPWKWIGVTHEYLDCSLPYSYTTLENVSYSTKKGGACSKHPIRKFLRNICLLEADLKKDPKNARSVFYLAESYRDAGMPEKSLAYYQKRIQMGGWQEEVFWSYLQTAKLLDKLGLSKNVVKQAYKDAHFYRRKRVEPVYYLAKIYNSLSQYKKAYNLISEYKEKWKGGKDTLFNMDWIETYALDLELSVSAHYLGKYLEAKKVSENLLKKKNLSPSIKSLIKKNLRFSLNELEKKAPQIAMGD